jgi:hypothetical protein
MQRRPPWLVSLRVILAFPLPLMLGNGVREVTRSAGAQAAVTVVAMVLGVWLGFVIARRRDVRRLAAGPRFGTRAWEAAQTAQLLEDVLEDRRRQLARATGDARARLEAELAHLGAQLEEQRRVAASGDPSPATGRIGFEPFLYP